MSMIDQQIKVAIADDHKIFRDGIKMALSGREHLKFLWEAEDGKDLMHKIQLKQPDPFLEMPYCNFCNHPGIDNKNTVRQ